jgi:hypothetical protein
MRATKCQEPKEGSWDTHDRYTSSPNENKGEGEDETNLVANIFLKEGERCREFSGIRGTGGRDTHVGTSIETLCTIPSVKEKRLVTLNLTELMTKAFNLHVRIGGEHASKGDFTRIYPLLRVKPREEVC